MLFAVSAVVLTAFNCFTFTASLFAAPSATPVIFLFPIPKFPEASGVSVKVWEPLAPLFNLSVLNVGSGFIPIVTIGSFVLSAFPINVARLVPWYLTPPALNTPVWNFTLPPKLVVTVLSCILSEFSAIIFNTEPVNCE